MTPKPVDYVLANGEQALMVLAGQVFQFAGGKGAPTQLSGIGYMLECLAIELKTTRQGQEVPT